MRFLGEPGLIGEPGRQGLHGFPGQKGKILLMKIIKHPYNVYIKLTALFLMLNLVKQYSLKFKPF